MRANIPDINNRVAVADYGASLNIHFNLLKKAITGREVPPDPKANSVIKFLLLTVVGTVVAIACLNWQRLENAKDLLFQYHWGKAFVLTGSAFLVINAMVLLWRIVLVWRYRPVPDFDDDRLPECTVVVPAFNEGRQVYETLKSIAASNYPKDKLHIVAVDDGSVDDTWHWIEKAGQDLGERLITLKQPCNKGKRHALYAGFQKSLGKVLVTIDSDSTVDPETLRCLVSPFIKNPQVGGVAGNVRVLNMQEGIIPKMLDVAFMFSFDFIRASESMVNTVMCTPGALSAYRRDIVMRVLTQWLNQTFCGKPANIGEDRAMTNLILKNGYYVHYQQNANVYTQVPVHYKNLCKMFLRWARSNIRESLVMSLFAFRRFRTGSMLGARINLIMHLLSLTKSQLLLLATLACVVWHPLDFGLNVMLGVVISSLFSTGFYYLRCRNTEALWGIAYGFYWLFSLSWIMIYALLTPQRSGWLTRQILVAPAAQVKNLNLERHPFVLKKKKRKMHLAHL